MFFEVLEDCDALGQLSSIVELQHRHLTHRVALAVFGPVLLPTIAYEVNAVMFDIHTLQREPDAYTPACGASPVAVQLHVWLLDGLMDGAKQAVAVRVAHFDVDRVARRQEGR